MTDPEGRPAVPGPLDDRAKPLTYPQQLEFLATAWRSTYGIERWTMVGLLLLRLPMPFLFLSHFWLSRWPLKRRKAATDLYCFMRLGFLATLLYTAAPGSVVHLGAAAYLLSDLMLSLISGILLNRPGLYGRPVSATRSVLLGLVNYWEINLAFAVAYLASGATCTGDGTTVSNPSQLLYFSTITMTTIGYGDVHPCTASGYWLATSQAFAALVLATFILSLFVARVQLEGPPQVADQGGA